MTPSTFVLSNDKEVLKTSKISQDVDRPKALGKNCSIPDDWLYPLCAYKVQVSEQEGVPSRSPKLLQRL